MGYGGIVFLMAIESACIPLPSEVIMPFAGFLVFLNRFGIWWVALAGTIGCVIGSIVAYAIGFWGGRPLVEKYGRYVLISHRDLERADNWFSSWGEITIFISRLLPIIRTFISLPAGIARMNFGRFILYTFLGSFPWCLGLAFLGAKLGENWPRLKVFFAGADWVIIVIIGIGIGWWIIRHFRNQKKLT